MSESVYICYEWMPPAANHGHGEWVTAGVVKNLKDAELWVEGFDNTEKNRRYNERTLNYVEAFYTQQQ